MSSIVVLNRFAILKAVGKLGSNFSFSIALIACLEIPINCAKFFLS
jgi:hypothetical protein